MACLVAVTPAHAEAIEADVCVFGGTSGGVAAAVQARRMGKSAVLLEPSRHLGGMTSGGLSAVDIGNPLSVGGIAREYFTKLAARYGRTLRFNAEEAAEVRKHATSGGAFAVEPHAAEKLFDEFAATAGVRVRFDSRLARVTKQGPRVTELTLEGGDTVRAKMFIDATYEGDLLAKAGVSYTLRREANSQYGETHNGYQYRQPATKEFGTVRPNGRRQDGRGVWDRTIPLDPYVKPGDPSSGLLPLISDRKGGPQGTEAPGVQAYCYRLCLTAEPSNRLPVAPPPDYDAKQYELIARYIAACTAAGDTMDLRWFSKHDELPNKKWDFNTAWLGSNLPGVGWDYAEATYEQREKIRKRHEDHARGLLHFLSADPRVPEKLRAEAGKYGLCKDEFPDSGGWPYQLYVREARRMVSGLVMTEGHARGRKVAPKSVALASYGIDLHEAQRIVHNGVVFDEGKLLGHGGIPGPYPVGYDAIVPKASECDNLYVTFCVSASHVCFGSTRMEPVMMALSQSAATAACQAIDANVGVQQLDYAKLRERLLRDGQVLDWAAAKK